MNEIFELKFVVFTNVFHLGPGRQTLGYFHCHVSSHRRPRQNMLVLSRCSIPSAAFAFRRRGTWLKNVHHFALVYRGSRVQFLAREVFRWQPVASACRWL